jgi:hypothetical protein
MYIIYDLDRPKIVEEVPPNLKWKLDDVILIYAHAIAQLYICQYGGKTFVKYPGWLSQDVRDYAIGKLYDKHITIKLQSLFKTDKDIPKDQILDVTNVIVPGKIEGELYLDNRVHKTRLVASLKGQFTDWKRYMIFNDNIGCCLVMYTKQNDRDYIRICRDVFPCFECKLPGYHNPHFGSLFCSKQKHCKDLILDIVIDITGSILDYELYDEHTIHDLNNAKIADEPLDAEWKPVHIYPMRSWNPLLVLLCYHDEKTFIKQSNILRCGKKDCMGPDYGYHCDNDFQRIFKCSGHCKDLPSDRVMDVTDVIVPQKIAGEFKIKSYNTGKRVVMELSGWKRYIFRGNEIPWLLMHTSKDGRDYLKICYDIFSCKCSRQPGYHQAEFEKLFGCKSHCSDLDYNTVIDATNLIERLY